MIEVNNLQKITAQRNAVDITAFKVDTGQVIGLIGPVGSGKVELLATLIGQSRPSSGTVRVANLDPGTNRERFSRIAGVLFPDDGLYQQCHSKA